MTLLEMKQMLIITQMKLCRIPTGMSVNLTIFYLYAQDI